VNPAEPMAGIVVTADAAPIPFVDLRESHAAVLPQLRAAFERVVARGAFVAGDEVETFESGLAAMVGAGHAVGVASGTAALHLALLGAGIGPGDEVILPPNTFFATAEAVMAVGATPVFADVSDDTALLDPAAVSAAVTERTAAVIAVHLYGQPADMDTLSAVARQHGLFLLEDAAQALGATWNGEPVGSLADAAAFSFYPAKNLGALGEAGAVTTRDRDLAARIRLLRNHGQTTKNVHMRFGLNERLDELQAAFLLAKLPYFAPAQQRRHQAVRSYRELFAGADVRCISQDPRAASSHHLFVVRVSRRDRIFDALQGAGVGVGIHYPTPIHLQPACHGLGGRPGQCPRAERLARTILSLPLYPGITTAQIERSVRLLTAALGGQA
jgi:dTDP-4-amino-4,6-dideoxygalactose transaminase